MPIVNGKYQNPGWVNGRRPAIDAAELNAISDTLERLDEAPVLPSLTNPGSAGDLLSGKQLIDANGNVLTGTMPDIGAVNKTIQPGTSYTIPAGRHNGNGKVTAGAGFVVPSSPDLEGRVLADPVNISARTLSCTLYIGTYTTKSRMFGISMGISNKLWSELQSLVAPLPQPGFGIIGLSVVMLDGNILSIVDSFVTKTTYAGINMWGNGSTIHGTVTLSGSGALNLTYTVPDPNMILGTDDDWRVHITFQD